ncbi:phage terminase large subunit-like protein [Antricoccus suffuscus]|uniref:Phage terminase large subunit-like protein n=1 Tax=Antricoccus suffuscus TaxID=1629062 RepID=A0A2T0ZZY7_9ACTN|nr:terminase large subunit [Antricoccus suffuscus]PRZ41915.1 phage terminase large subunit-like protein [Antricoccus suffuscus]
MAPSRPGPKAPITAPPLDFSHLPPRGWERVEAFATRYLKVPKGTGAGDPFLLRPWQLDIIKGLFPQCTETRPRQGLLSLPRGNGKTALAAVLALYALFADDTASAQVLIVASDERQARHVFTAARRMIELAPSLDEQVHVYTDRIVVPHTGSELRTLPADVGALQGWDPSLMIVDELHVVTEDVWEAVSSASGKRETSLTLAISTPSDSVESVMFKLVEYGRADDDASFYFKEYAAPAGCALDDETAWYTANPALDDFLHIDAMRAQSRTIREPAFRRYRLGQWVGSEDTWLKFGVWDGLANPDRVVAPGSRVALGFDGSVSGDSTALYGATIEARPHIFLVGVWNNPGSDDWKVPRAEVRAAVDRAFSTYDVVELAADPWGWQSELQSWAETYGERRVVEFNTGYRKRMAPATDLMYQAIQDGRVSHDADPTLRAHISNAQAVTTAQGDVLQKDERKRKRRIDAAIAAVVAHARAHHYLTHKPKKRAVSW